MTFNSSGVRDISRVLNVSTNTVLSQIRCASTAITESRVPTRAARVELDEFWSFVGAKKNQRWMRAVNYQLDAANRSFCQRRANR